MTKTPEMLSWSLNRKTDILVTAIQAIPFSLLSPYWPRKQFSKSPSMVPLLIQIRIKALQKSTLCHFSLAFQKKICLNLGWWTQISWELKSGRGKKLLTSMLHFNHKDSGKGSVILVDLLSKCVTGAYVVPKDFLCFQHSPWGCIKHA